MIGIHESNPWVAWQFDNAVALFGTYIDNKRAETDPKTHKSIWTIEELLDLPKVIKKAAMNQLLSHYGRDFVS